jgi:hypothetical protein
LEHSTFSKLAAATMALSSTLCMVKSNLKCPAEVRVADVATLVKRRRREGIDDSEVKAPIPYVHGPS